MLKVAEEEMAVEPSTWSVSPTFTLLGVFNHCITLLLHLEEIPNFRHLNVIPEMATVQTGIWDVRKQWWQYKRVASHDSKSCGIRDLKAP